MYIKELIDWLEHRSVFIKWLIFALIVVLGLLSNQLVLSSGGTRNVFVHTMYIPVVLASLAFGMTGGIVSALIGGLLLGPGVPVDTATGQLQTDSAWIFRTGFFLLVGIMIGASSDLIRMHLRQMRWRLHFDELSQLPNKHSLLVRLDKLLAGGQEACTSRHLYLIDIGNLEENILKLGPRVKKLVICKLAERLQAEFEEDAEYFHIRGMQIGLIGGEPEDVGPAIDKVLSRPVIYEGIPLLLNYVWASVGLDEELDDSEVILRRAEVSVTEAYNRGAPSFQYIPGLEQHARRNVELLGLFKSALDGNSLNLHYQPKYHLSNRQTHSVEALLRWIDPLQGFISPGEFIPLVENSSLIHPMTLWVIDRALSDLVSLRKDGISLTSVAVNISAVNLMADDFVESVRRIVDKHEVEPGSLELELTENAVMKDVTKAVATLNQISNAGISISIDDFGTGFSSLQYLDQLPIESVKIDQLFVRNMLADGSKLSIIEATTDLAKRMALSTVAEGIETQQIEDRLAAAGCHYGQGFHYSKPLPFQQLCDFLLQPRPQPA